MSAAASQALPRSLSTKRQHTHAPPDDRDRSHVPSTPSPGVSDSPRRSMSVPQGPGQPSHHRAGSNNQGNLNHVARRDSEQLNLARPSAAHRIDSREQPSRDGGMSRADSTRNGQPARYTHSRHQSEANSSINGTSHEASSRQAGSETLHAPRRRTTVEAKSGVWELGKTIGAGSMGKVKLARHRDTHEQVSERLVCGM